jgi:hypothetical protein
MPKQDNELLKRFNLIGLFNEGELFEKDELLELFNKDKLLEKDELLELLAFLKRDDILEKGELLEKDEILELLERNELATLFYHRRVDAAGRDKDIWKPVPPALAGRISAAVKSWGTLPNTDRFREILKAINGLELPNSEPHNEKAFWGMASIQIAKMEEYFLYILEDLPPTGVLSKDDTDPLTQLLASSAVAGLVSTAWCRRDIGSGRSADVATDMHLATDLYWVIRILLDEDAREHLIAKAINYREGYKSSTNTKAKKSREKYLEWLAMDLELIRNNPHWGPTGRAQAIGEKVGRSESRILTVLRLLREEENGPTADS